MTEIAARFASIEERLGDLTRALREDNRNLPELRYLKDTERLGHASDGQVPSYHYATGQWRPINPAGVAATTVVTETAFGQSSAVGVLLPYARVDHTHGTPTNPVPAHEAAGDPHPQYLTTADPVPAHAATHLLTGTDPMAVATAVAAGLLAAADKARLDTVLAASAVVSEITFSQASAIGVLAAYARQDHSHGTMLNPVPGHEAAGNPHPGYGALGGTQTWIGANTFYGSLAVTNVGGFLLHDRPTNAQSVEWYSPAVGALSLYSYGSASDRLTLSAAGALNVVVGPLSVAGTAVVLTTDTRLTDARTPTGAAGGILAGTYPNPSLAADRVRIGGDTMTGSLTVPDITVGAGYPISYLNPNQLTLVYDASNAMAMAMVPAVSGGVGKGIRVFNPVSGVTLAQFCESSSYFDIGPALGQTSAPASGKRVAIGMTGNATTDFGEVGFIYSDGFRGGMVAREGAFGTVADDRQLILASSAASGNSEAFVELRAQTSTTYPEPYVGLGGNTTVTGDLTVVGSPSATGTSTIHASDGVFLASYDEDVAEIIGIGAATVRTVNEANSAYRVHEASTHTNISDMSAKRNVRPLPAGTPCLNAIAAQRPFRFNWKEGWGDNGAADRFGLDAATVPPEVQAPMSLTTEPGLKGIDTSAAIALLWGAVAELADRLPPIPQPAPVRNTG